MHRTAAYATFLALAFGGSWFIQHQENTARYHHECLARVDRTHKYNNTVYHLELTEDAIIDSNKSSDSNLHKYQSPPSVEKLEKAYHIEQLPIPKC